MYREGAAPAEPQESGSGGRGSGRAGGVTRPGRSLALPKDMTSRVGSAARSEGERLSMGEKFLTFLGRSELWVAGAALIVFLVLTWVFRGAPPGQAIEAEEDADAPRAGYRERIVA